MDASFGSRMANCEGFTWQVYALGGGTMQTEPGSDCFDPIFNTSPLKLVPLFPAQPLRLSLLVQPVHPISISESGTASLQFGPVPASCLVLGGAWAMRLFLWICIMWTIPASCSEAMCCFSLSSGSLSEPKAFRTHRLLHFFHVSTFTCENMAVSTTLQSPAFFSFS